jgi:hypothetical protein
MLKNDGVCKEYVGISMVANKDMDVSPSCGGGTPEKKLMHISNNT